MIEKPIEDPAEENRTHNIKINGRFLETALKQNENVNNLKVRERQC